MQSRFPFRLKVFRNLSSRENRQRHVIPINDTVMGRDISKGLVVRFRLHAIKRHERPVSDSCANLAHQLIRDTYSPQKSGVPHSLSFNVHLDRLAGPGGAQPVETAYDEIEESTVSVDPLSCLDGRLLR